MTSTTWLTIVGTLVFGCTTGNAFLVPTTRVSNNNRLLPKLYEERVIVEDRFSEEEREAAAAVSGTIHTPEQSTRQRGSAQDERRPKDLISKRTNEDEASKLECPKLFRDFWPGDISTLDTTIEKRTNALTKIQTMKLLTAALDSWAKARGRDDAAERCYLVLQHLRTHGTEHGLVANEFIFNVVINAFGRRHQPERAESIFREMMEDPNVKPTGYSFNSVIKAYARSHAYGASKRCMQLLEEMKEMKHIEGPSRLSYNIVLDVLAKRGQAETASEILQEMIDHREIVPDTISYNCVLHAWSNSKAVDAPDKCLKLFEEMDMEAALENVKCKPDLKTYTIVIDALAKRGRAHEAGQMIERMAIETETKPDTVTLNSLLHALSKSSDPDAPKKAMDIMREMHEAYTKEKDLTVRPDVVSYNSLISTFANHGLAKDAELVVQMMMEEDETVDPDVISFCTAIKAWSKSTDARATDHCLQILREQKDFAKRTRDKKNNPNTVTYNCVINAFAQRGEAVEAERLLHEMLQEKLAFPNTVTFNTVINAWANAEDKPNAPERCMQLLTEMNKLAEKYGRKRLVPDSYTDSAIYRAYAKYGREDEVAHLKRNKSSAGKVRP